MRHFQHPEGKTCILIFLYKVWLGSWKCKTAKNKMIREMIKPTSKDDKPGFIYGYSIQKEVTNSQEKYAYFKIGRTVDPHRRMYALSKICKYDPKVIELFPSLPGKGRMPNNLQMIDGKIDSMLKCPITHRVERLILLEMACLFKKVNTKCPVCGARHREWFKVERKQHPKENRLMTDRELWVTCVRPIILRWIQYGVIFSAISNNK